MIADNILYSLYYYKFMFGDT